MRRFTRLYDELDATTRTNEKIAAMRRYFEHAPPEDAAWAVFFLTGGRFKRTVKYTQLRDWICEETRFPRWLVEECYDAVGDLSETIALLMPEVEQSSDATLSEIVHEHIEPLPRLDDERTRATIVGVWRSFNARQRFVFHKLLFGGFRVGASRRLVIRALAEFAEIDPAIITHRLSGAWRPSASFFTSLIDRLGEGGETLRPYPFFLASPLERGPDTLGDVGDWQFEWKWDGIRVQLLRRGGETMLWSRGEELITDGFPDLARIGDELPDGTVLDGEIVAWEGDRPLPFNLLQRRIGRRNVEPMLWMDVPVVFMAFDLLEREGDDVRTQTMAERRARLEAIAEGVRCETLRLSPVLDVATWDDCAARVEQAREIPAEGLMIKRRESPYRVGRTRGDWWKWKVDPFTVDAVLIYAQSGHGRRASLYTDYTFGVWENDELVPVAKAYSGLTDEEIRQVDRHVCRTTVGRHGPVRLVKPELVFELAFEGIQRSTRHKAGLALRFPRMNRWRHDKKPADADTIDALRTLLARQEGAQA